MKKIIKTKAEINEIGKRKKKTERRKQEVGSLGCMGSLAD